ncbi:uroporphyrinogen decarboxylase [Paenalcaligenes hominis]|uniref:Uroporphyrinogen decarboxylase n=3 Tax=Paenalcaligenes hominis TaxID=643674 RepID=A0ABX0WNU7_9BURK|nr:uroporphyrinogen decarboxylase [Paenalcaligenes hominis]NJB64948.1 uroporphyrinogen decarboxylase [Paenalcaligenes hominis]GGE57864.1 uroporphyrinogen decarboxylase [Paenalcaligenes hominis]
MSLPQLKNDILLRSLLREPVPYTPVWLMRQAGRYLPEYRATRAEAGSFMGLAQNKEYACEVTLQPLRRFDLDAAILFSDILTVPHAMGLGLDFVHGEGPQFAHPIKDEDDVKRLAVPDMAKLQYVFDAVNLIRRELDGKVPLIGFAGSPWTIACYMVEGRGSADYRKIKGMMYGRPDLVHQILEINAQTTIQYLNEQIRAGAQAAMIFDSWGGVMADTLFQEFSLAYTKKVVDGLIRDNDGRRVPVIVFTKGGGQWLEDIVQCGADAVGVDWTVNLTRARQRLQDQVAFQGNMDPMVMFGGAEAVTKEVRRVIDDFGVVGKGGHVFNFGHGISQFTDPEMVKVLVDEVHSYSAKMHQA